MPDTSQQAARLAPNEVMLQLFDEWAAAPDRAEARYVLALLLVRRKVFRLVESAELAGESPPVDALRVECPSRDTTYDLPVATPDAEHAATIQAELNALLFADSA